MLQRHGGPRHPFSSNPQTHPSAHPAPQHSPFLALPLPLPPFLPPSSQVSSLSISFFCRQERQRRGRGTRRGRAAQGRPARTVHPPTCARTCPRQSHAAPAAAAAVAGRARQRPGNHAINQPEAAARLSQSRNQPEAAARLPDCQTASPGWLTGRGWKPSRAPDRSRASSWAAAASATWNLRR